MLILYYSPGACSLAVHIALQENNLPYQLVKVDLHTHLTEDNVDFSTINPKNYVPTIKLDGATLTEAAAILFYIANTTKDIDTPKSNDPFAAYRIQEALTFVSSELHKSVGAFFNKDVPEGYKEIAREKISKRLNFLESVLSKQEYLVGNEFTVADAYCFTVLRWLKHIDTGLTLSDWKKVHAYYIKINERPKVKQVFTEEGLRR